jgi:D-ribulokinase
MRQAFIGVDVGTSSARAGIFDEKGSLLATARHPITVWREAGSVVEQSSSEIWAACATSVRAAMAEAAIPPSAIKGLGFDATCSLVVLDAGANPLTVSASGDERRNVIVWMDHRAIAEARLVSSTHDDVLRYVGGSISPEMEIPKLLWLKKHLPSTYHSAGHFFDLADYLSFRATGSTARSMCTLACKWNYLAHERRWSGSYFERIGLGDLASDKYAKIGKDIVATGTPLGTGLTKSAAGDLGLLEGTPVGASLIDAHAGGVGTIGGREKSGKEVDLCRRLAYIMGTSACIMATTSEPCFVPGVWGPYYSGMVTGFWLNEGGQSAAGAAIDHLIRSHPAYNEAVAAARAASVEVLEYLERRIVSRSGSPGDAALLARDVHVMPEFLGNRSPFADPDSRAVVRDGSRRRPRLDGAAVRGRAVRACLRSCRCRRSVSIARRERRSDGDQRRRRTKFAGPADHGGYDGPYHCGPRNAGTGLARGGHAGRRCGQVLRIDWRGHGLYVGDRPAERGDGARDR